MHSKCVCIFAEMGFLLIIFAEILLTIWDPHPAQIVKNHRGTRYGLAQGGGCGPHGWIHLAIPVAGLGLVVTSVFRSTCLSQTGNYPGSRTGRGSQDTVIPNSHHLCSLWATLEYFANQERGHGPVVLRLLPGKTTGRQRGRNWIWWMQLDCTTNFKKHPTRPVKNKDPTGGWWPQETGHQLYHFFCTRSSFESVNGGFM